MNARLLVAFLLLAACGDDSQKTAVPGVPGAFKTVASARAERRLFAGAPPVIPHHDFGADCVSCHTTAGMSVPQFGFAPPSPHDPEQLQGGMARCRMCHVSAGQEPPFADNDFVGLRQDLRAGKRLNDLAPPVIPHQTLLRENCMACHTGPAAREEIRCPHPERERCVQCHLPQQTTGEFSR